MGITISGLIHTLPKPLTQRGVGKDPRGKTAGREEGSEEENAGHEEGSGEENAGREEGSDEENAEREENITVLKFR